MIDNVKNTGTRLPYVESLEIQPSIELMRFRTQCNASTIKQDLLTLLCSTQLPQPIQEEQHVFLPISVIYPCSERLPPCVYSQICHNAYNLPLRLLPVQEPLENRNNFLQRRQPRPQLTLHPLLIALTRKLRIEVFAVRTRAHRSAEDRLHQERVVRLERTAVRGAERGRDLFGRVSEVLRYCDGGEF